MMSNSLRKTRPLEGCECLDKLVQAFADRHRLMCATVADKGETVLFRSYRLPGDSRPQSETAQNIDHDNITIKEACRATSAAPTYLPPLKVPGRDRTMITFWDGGLLNNNPVD